MRRIHITLLILVAFVISASVACADGIVLGYKFQKGELTKYKLFMDMKIDMPQMGQMSGPVAGRMQTTSYVNMRVIDVYSDGSAKVKISCTSPKVKSSGFPGGSKQVTMPQNGFYQIVRMWPDGSSRVLDVDNNTKVQIRKAGTNGMDMKSLIQNQVNPAVFPLYPVVPGMIWDSHTDMPMGAGMMDMSYCFTGTAEDYGYPGCLHIRTEMDGYGNFNDMLKGLSAKLRKKVPDAPSVDMGMQMDMDGEINTVFSPREGKMIKTVGNMYMRMQMQFGGALSSKDMPNNMGMAMDIDMKMVKI